MNVGQDSRNGYIFDSIQYEINPNPADYVVQSSPDPPPEVLVPQSIYNRVESSVENSNSVDKPQPGTGHDLIQSLHKHY